MNKSLWHLLVTKKHPMPPSTKFVSTWTDIYIYIYIMVAKQDINAWFLEAWWHWRVIDSDPVGMNNREATVMTTGLLPGKVTYSRKKKKCLEDYLPFEMVPFQLTCYFSGGYMMLHDQWLRARSTSQFIFNIFKTSPCAWRAPKSSSH